MGVEVRGVMGEMSPLIVPSTNLESSRRKGVMDT